MNVLRQYPKLMVLSIDGVPHGLLQKLVDQGDMPNMAALIEQAGLRSMRSVQPTVSSVAWASYMTGKNPAKHGVYGFLDRRDGSYQLSFPNAGTMAADNIWQMLSRDGKTVFGMNVPTSFPPQPVNGILIGGFLSPSLGKVAYPGSVGDYLRSIDYRIDSDAALARQDKRAMLADLDKTLDSRMEAMFHFLDGEGWDFFHTHIMGSDRINHFLYQKMEEGDSEFAPAFFAYYRRIDEAIGRLLDRLPDDVPLLIFSDHGFCSIKQEVQLSRFLVEAGWTTAADKIEHPLSIDPTKSRAYCLIPGRIFVNLAGREPQGIVPVEDYQETREQLTADLLQLRDPQTNEAVIRRVLRREEVYWPDGRDGCAPMEPQEAARATGVFGKAADLIAIPYDGYDLKLGLAGRSVFLQTQLEGMHTYDDAFMVARHVELPEENLEILMVARSILGKMGVKPPVDLDGIGNAVTPTF